MGNPSQAGPESSKDGEMAAGGGEASPAGRTTRIRFLDQLSPTAQQAYQDEQERKREEKKSEISGLQESTKIQTIVEQPPGLVANQTADNTEYNRVKPSEVAASPAEPQPEVPRTDCPQAGAPEPTLFELEQQPGNGGGRERYGGPGGYQNPVFDPEFRERKPPRRWSFRRTNSGRDLGRVCPVSQPGPRNGMVVKAGPGQGPGGPEVLGGQQVYLQEQQQQVLQHQHQLQQRYYRQFSVEHQLRYGIAPTGEPLELARLAGDTQLDIPLYSLQISGHRSLHCTAPILMAGL